MKKRLLERGLSLLLAFVMVLALAPVFTIEAEAAEDLGVSVSSFSELKEELTNGTSKVNITSNIVLEDNLEVPDGVTINISNNASLLVPYGSEHTIQGANHKHPYSNSSAGTTTTNAMSNPNSNIFRTLVLGERAKIIVNSGSKLVVGGQYGGSGQPYGAHGVIKLNGTGENAASIMLNDGSIMSACGYVMGGKTVVESGATVYALFSVFDYTGGTYTAVSYMKRNISPFVVYGMPTLQSEMTMMSGSTLVGYCDLYASSSHNLTSTKIIGKSESLLNLASGYLTISYDGSKVANKYDYLGKTTIRISGNLSVGSLSMEVSGVDVNTNTVVFPVPFNFRIEQLSDTLSVPVGIKLMPGSELIVGENAKVNITDTLYVYDGSNTPIYSGKTYPTGSDFGGNFEERARLVVNGVLEISSNAVFAGKVETKKLGKVIVSENAKALEATAYEGVVKGDKYVAFIIPFTAVATNRTAYSLAAEVFDYNANEWVPMVKGNTYYAVSDCSVNLSGFKSQKHGGSETTVAYSNVTTADGAWLSEKDYRSSIFTVAASYNEDGKMTGVAADWGLDHLSADLTGNIKVYMLDSSYAPIGDVVRQFTKN